jgi:O-antigen/teichoic acid export membrane protein
LNPDPIIEEFPDELPMDDVPPANSRSALHKRLAAGFGANLFGRGVSTLITFVSVPIFLRHWGADLYGEWLLLNTVPSYFNLSDIGFGSSAGNEMTMLMASGKQAEALDVFQSVLALTTVISTAIGVLFVALVWFLPFNRWLHVNSITAHDTNLTILLLALSVLLSMQETLFQAAFRCVAKYAYGGLLKSFIQLAAFLGVSVVVLFGGGVVAAAAAFCIINAIGTLLLWFELRRCVPWIRFGIQHAHMATLRRLTGPSISFMAFPLGNAISLQGMLLVVGVVLGPTAVVIFSTARTVSRSVIQFMQMINNSVWPEMSLAVGANDFSLARSLHRRSCQISIAIGLGAVAALALVGPSIWKRWTVHTVATDTVLLDLMLTLVVFSSLWFTSSVALAATNRVQRLAIIYLIATSASLGAAWFLAHAYGIRGAAVALIGAEIFMSAFVLRASLAFLGDTFTGFMRSMFSIPKLIHWRSN